MNDREKIEMLKKLTGPADKEVLSAFLKIAGEEIINRAYPFLTANKEVPKKYELLQIRIASYLFAKQGAEGQTSHSENGVTRGYGSADIPPSMLRSVIPMAEVLE